MSSKQDQCSEDLFLSDVATHQMTIIRDDEHGRHLRFRKPNRSEYWFDIITWPGSLCIDGDMGTYVFRRLTDMFEFFRTDREYYEKRGRKLVINRSYWAEKIQAMPGNGVKEFDDDKFNSRIYEYLVNWIRDHREDTTKEERRDLWDSVKWQVIGADGDSDGSRKQISAHEFHHTVNVDLEFYFQDFWETDCTRYTFHFLWCCYAIAWAVKQYDEAKEQKPAEAVAA